jgi:hypothetical protein
MEGKLTVAKVKQVIFSAAANHGIRDVGPFLQSAAKHVPGSRAFLLLYPKDLGRSEALEIRKSGTGVDFLLAPRWGRRIRPWVHRLAVALRLHRRPYETTPPRIRLFFRGALHITVERFLSALDFAEQHGGDYESLMISDSRDVIFQADPFSLGKGRLLTGEEAVCFPDPETNGPWYRRFYGENGCARLAGQPVLCSGLTFGPADKMKAYLAAMAGEIWRQLPRLGPDIYCDQGIHNHVIREQGIPVEPTPSGEGIIATVGMMDPGRVKYLPSVGSVEVDGKTAALLHQYDRHPALARSIRKFLSDRNNRA